MNHDRSKTVTIVSSRINRAEMPILKQHLRKVVERFITEGYHTFISPIEQVAGRALAQIVIEAKRENPEIKLIVVLNYFRDDSFTATTAEFNADICNYASEIIYATELHRYPNTITVIDLMLDRSSALIAVNKTPSPNVRYAVDRAILKGHKILIEGYKISEIAARRPQ